MSKKMMLSTIEHIKENLHKNYGGPFAAIIVKDGEVIAKATNSVTSTNDPTAHAEVNVIRKACQALNSFDLKGCEIYTSCEPCPMCLAAIYWARLDRVYYAAEKMDAAKIGFDDEFIYKELDKPIEERSIPMHQFEREAAVEIFKAWEDKIDKTHY